MKTVPDQTIHRLVGVYNAEGSLRGEASYLLAKLLRRRDSCALCDLTHRGFRRRTDFDDAAQGLPVPLEFRHLDQRTADMVEASEGYAPCVLAETATSMVMLLGPHELQACGGSPSAFVQALRRAAEERGLQWLDGGSPQRAPCA